MAAAQPGSVFTPFLNGGAEVPLLSTGCTNHTSQRMGVTRVRRRHKGKQREKRGFHLLEGVSGKRDKGC